jgi:hypothetical protein
MIFLIKQEELCDLSWGAALKVADCRRTKSRKADHSFAIDLLGASFAKPAGFFRPCRAVALGSIAELVTKRRLPVSAYEPQ